MYGQSEIGFHTSMKLRCAELCSFMAKYNRKATSVAFAIDERMFEI